MEENLTVFVNRRKKLTTRDELEKCSKEVSVHYECKQCLL